MVSTRYPSCSPWLFIISAEDLRLGTSLPSRVMVYLLPEPCIWLAGGETGSFRFQVGNFAPVLVTVSSTRLYEGASHDCFGSVVLGVGFMGGAVRYRGGDPGPPGLGRFRRR